MLRIIYLSAFDILTTTWHFVRRCVLKARGAVYALVTSAESLDIFLKLRSSNYTWKRWLNVQSLCFCPPVCRCPRGNVGGFEEKPQVMFFFILLSYRLQQRQAWSSLAGLIPLLFPSTTITNVFDLQQTDSRSTDRIHKKSWFSERTSRGRETGQWGHITKSTSSFIFFVDYYVLPQIYY